ETGDPMKSLKWTRKSLDKIAFELKSLGIVVSANTVGRLLKEMGYSLRINLKTVESGNANPPTPEIRNQQFKNIAKKRAEYEASGNPAISVDTKKRELVGNFKNNGSSWRREPIHVKDHDFPSDAIGKATPYGIYDTLQNQGFVSLGVSCDTPRFAVDAIETWWSCKGINQYADAKQILILADSGGSNSARSRVWKMRLQEFANRFNVKIDVCHYPPGASKWNPIEHRLFSEISKNWGGKPLVSFQTILNYIRTTRTCTGLNVTAVFNRKKYYKGEKVPNDKMAKINLLKHNILPKWNYSLAPHRL
ncbi:MAG: ISAzo13 family transposase, partial [Desulfovermiculus sp.]|nr:ISAzo13 family transposase [Desulfovermiculus sp.]